jgi:hypothetical protein
MARPKTVETSEKLKASAVHIKDSAAQMERSTARVEDSADRRTELAAISKTAMVVFFDPSPPTAHVPWG